MGNNLSEIDDDMYRYAASQIQSGKTGLSVCGDTYVEVSAIPNSDWAAVTYVPQAEILKELDSLYWTMLARVLLVVLVLFILVIFWVRKLVGKPVKELNRVASEIAAGNQVSSVVQTNSATAQESAAASEELSEQARLLKQLVSRFRLKEIRR